MPAPTAPLKFEHLRYWREQFTTQYAAELAAGDMTRMDILELAHTAADESCAACERVVTIKLKTTGGKNRRIKGEVTVTNDPTNGTNPVFFNPVAELAKAGY